MEWLWKFESLVKLLENETPLVREWATERLVALYPERLGPVAIRYIEDPLERISTATLIYFIEHPQPEYADELLKAYSAEHRLRAGMLAKALSRLKDARLIETFRDKYAVAILEDPVGYVGSVVHIASLQAPQSAAIAKDALQRFAQSGEPDHEVREILPAVFSANLITGTPIDHLFEFCFAQANWSPWLLTWLIALGDGCGSWINEFDLVQEHPSGAPKKNVPDFVEKSLEDLSAVGLQEMARTLRKNFKRGRYAEVLQQMHQALLKLTGDARDAAGADRFAVWLQGKGRPRQNMDAIGALCAHIGGKDPDAQKMMAHAAFPIFSILMKLRPLIGLDIDSLDTKALLEIFLQDRETVEEDQKIADRLHAAGEIGRIAASMLEFIERRPRSLAMERLIEFLGDHMDANIAERLLMLESDIPELGEGLALAASRLGAPLLDILPAVVESQKPAAMTRSLELMRRLPCEGAATLLLNHWDQFWTLDKLILLEAVQDIGDRRFIAPLRNELREMEIQEAQTYRLLCLIHGVETPLLNEIEAEAEARSREHTKIQEALSSGDLTAVLDQPLNLELKCRRCRKIYTYPVEEVTMLPDAKGDYIIADHIRCKNCGALDDYEKTAESNMAVMGRNLALLAIGDKARKYYEKGPLRFAQSKRIGGKARSIDEALLYYEEMLAQKPDHVPSLIGYANTLSNAKRAEDAVASYRKAIEHDPLAVEAIVSLGQNAAAYGRLEEAYGYLKQAVEILDYGHYYRVSQDLGDFKAGVYEVYAEAALNLGKDLEPIARPTAPAKKLKIGRNDPCPCGSGKKYKKCCLVKEQ
ncbi:MAG: SEC-C domain-containing protein [Desulfobacterales bacterium]|jgi:tetratricopeptide (TPR) repeat protein|nr:SEC-C domain-containing protein [Desulfobacterales bacterium]